MSQTSPRLGLPFLLPQQSQKHVTINEAFRRLDALSQLSVVSQTVTAQPSAPVDGDCYVLPAGKTGEAWGGMAVGAIACRVDGAWVEMAPRLGWRAQVTSDNRQIVYTGSAWSELVQSQSPLYGVNTTADATNRLAVKANASLFNHDDVTPGAGDHRLTINKAAAARTGTVVFQSSAVGRAEVGLAGEDDFSVRVSGDGAAWRTGLRIDRSNGRATFPSGGVREQLSAARSYFVRTDGNDANTGLADSAGGAFRTLQKAVDMVGGLDVGIFDVTIEVGPGTYTGQTTLKNFVGAGQCLIRGLGGVAVLAAATGPTIAATGLVSRWALGTNLRLETTTSGSAIFLDSSRLTLSGATFGATSGGGYHMVLDRSGVFVNADYAIAGGGAGHVFCSTGSDFVILGPRTITLTGTPAFTDCFVRATGLAVVRAPAVTFVGSATGVRYVAELNSVINTSGGGASYLPGSMAGILATGGQYA